jgi:hypothetical protein
MLELGINASPVPTWPHVVFHPAADRTAAGITHRLSLERIAP